MKKALVILFIFRIKCILGDGNIQKAEPIFHSNSTIRYSKDDTNPSFFHSRHARDKEVSCSKCGYEGSKMIIGGGPKVTPSDKYPWMVYIRARRSAGGKELACGGALINEYFVITAAHCTTNKENPHAAAQHFVDIRVFFVMESCRKVFPGPVVERVYPHPEYDGSHANDISLIKLRSKVRCTGSVKPICLPNTNADRITPMGRSVFASGWGISKEYAQLSKKEGLNTQEADPGSIHPGRDLREAHMSIGTPQMCRGQNPIYKNPLPFLLCVIPDKKQFTCSGDSGSPLVLNFKGRYFIVGVHSGRKGRTCSKAPKIANSVPHHMKWIRQVTGLRPDYPVARAGTHTEPPHLMQHVDIVSALRLLVQQNNGTKFA